MSEIIEGENGRFCTCCRILKLYEKFPKSPNKRDGVREQCNDCTNLRVRNKQKYKIHKEICRLGNIEIEWVDGELLMEGFNARICNRCDKFLLFDNFYKRDGRKYGHDSRCKKCIGEVNKGWKNRNLEKRKRYKKKWNEEHGGYYNKYNKKRRKRDINFKLIDLYRNRQYKIFSNLSINKETKSLLGCSVEKSKQYIEEQFTEDMTWDNHGRYWQIDHVIPVSLFDQTCEYQRAVCWHYSNLQPLTTEENQSKGNDILAFSNLTIDKEFLDNHKYIN